MAVDDAKFTCMACGKEYRWKPELAGRKAKCGCGAALVVPAERPGGAAPPVAAARAAAVTRPAESPASASIPVASTAVPVAAPAGAACPSCAASLAPNAVLCVNCGYNLKTGKMLSVVVERDEPEPDEPPAKTAVTAKPSP